MLKIISIMVLIPLLILILFAGRTAIAADFELDIESAILMAADTGQILYEKNADERLHPASLTKIMTLLLAMEKVEEGEISFDDEVTISDLAESMGGSQIFLSADTSIPFGELLKAVAIASANDASVAVAEAVAGSYGNFINLMNEKAEELGMENTYFSNSTGLPTNGEHYTTARDVAIMARELVQYPEVLEWASIWVDYLQLPDRRAMLANTNKLINKYPGLDGLKTGYTQEAGFCLAATASRDMRLISVVMKAESEREREELTSRLLDYGFNRFNMQTIAEKGEQIQNIKVPEGSQLYTTGELASNLQVMVRNGEENLLQTETVVKKEIILPVHKGDVIGEKRVLKENELLNSVDILATEKITRANIIIRWWRILKNWIAGFLP